MNTQLYLVLCIFVLGNTKLISSQCPDPTVILPCYGCEDRYVTCAGDKDIDLVNIFTKLSQSLQPNQKHFISFHLNNTMVTEIKANTFIDIAFDKIEIIDTNLKHIDLDAFATTNNVTNVFVLKNNPKLNQDTIYTLMSKLTNVKSIDEGGNFNRTNVIPANAFGNQPNLKTLTLSSDEQGIGSNAIKGLSSLKTIDFKSGHITHISVNAFAIDKPSNDGLAINLNNNRYINELSFEKGALENINRPTYIWLGDLHNDIKYLPQHVFLPYFNSNVNNTLFVETWYFDLQDCRSFWLKQHNLLKRVRTDCYDDCDIEDPDNFADCVV